MKIAYKVFCLTPTGALKPCCVDNRDEKYYVESEKNKVNKPKKGKFFVFGKMPTAKQIGKILHRTQPIKVFRCMVDTLVPVTSITIPPDYNYYAPADSYWADYEALGVQGGHEMAIEDTFFCNEVYLLKDVTNLIKR